MSLPQSYCPRTFIAFQFYSFLLLLFLFLLLWANLDHIVNGVDDSVACEDVVVGQPGSRSHFICVRNNLTTNWHAEKNHKCCEDENGTNLQWWNWHNAKIAKQKLNELIRCESKICYFEHDHLHRNNIFKVYQGYRNLNNNKWVDLMQIHIGFEKLCKIL